MPTSAKVAVGLLGNAVGNTTDLTVSGFGTPTAALFFACSATPTNNPQPNATQAIGLWTPSASRSVSVDDDNGQSTTRAARQFANSPLVLVNASSTDSNLLTFTAATITDGLRLTVSSGSSGIPDRYVVAVLFKGTLGVHVGTVDLGTGTAGINVTSPGFRPDLLFFTTAGGSFVDIAGNVLFSFGAAHIDSADSITQGAVNYASNDNVSTSQTNSYATAAGAAAQVFTDTLDWRASITAVLSTGFTIQPNANAGGDLVAYMALRLADPDDAYVGLLDTRATTGSQATTGTGFTPEALILAAVQNPSADTVGALAATSFGATDGTRSRAVGAYSRDNVSTTVSDSYASTTAPLFLRSASSGAVDTQAGLTSFDSDGWTLNYTTASATRKMLAIAIGDSTAGGAPTITALSAIGITASNAQPRISYS